jgi:hypothetical protein
MWTKTSLPPSSGWIKPKPLVALNHFTVPVAIFEFLLSLLRVRPGAEAVPVSIEILEIDAADPNNAGGQIDRPKYQWAQHKQAASNRQGEANGSFNRAPTAPANERLIARARVRTLRI